MSFSFNCPTCRQVLQTAEPVPIGRSVKCPACGNVFIPPPMPVDAGPARAYEAPAAAPASGREDEGYGRSPSPRPREEESYGRPSPRPRDEENYGRPAPRPREEEGYGRPDAPPSRHGDYNERRPAPKKGSGPLLAILGVTVLLLVVAVVVGGFIWPGFFRSRGTDFADMYAYLPAKYDSIFGVDVNAVRDRKIVSLIEKAIKDKEGFKDSQLEFIKKSADRLVVAGDSARNEFVVVFTMPSPPAADKVREIFEADKGEKVGDKTVYSCNVGGELYMVNPNEKTVILGILESKEDFAKLADGKGKLPSSLDEPVREASNASFWAVADLKASKGGQKVAGQAGMAADLGGINVPAEEIKKSSALGFSVTLGQGAKIRLTLHCASSADASVVQKAGVELKSKLDALIKLAGHKVPADVKPVLDDVNTLDFRQSGSTVTGSLQISEANLTKLEKFLEGGAAMEGRGGEGRLAPRWEGHEGRPGFGKLIFDFESDDEVVRINEQGNKEGGKYHREGKKIFLTFSDARYEGVVDGPTMSGTAQADDKKWKWTVKERR